MNTTLGRLGAATLGLVVAGTVLAATSPADAAVAGGADYTCTTPVGDQTLPVAVASDQLPATVPAGFDVPGTPVDVDITVPASLGDTLRGFGITAVGGSTGDFTMALGPAPVPVVGIAIDPVTTVEGQPTVLSATATTGASTTPNAGTRDLDLPSRFTFALRVQDGVPFTTLTCTLGAGQDATIGQVEVTKQGSTTTAKPVRRTVRVGTAPKVKVTVGTELGGSAAGRVRATAAGRTVGTGTLSGGKVTLRLAKVRKPGRLVITVGYAGNGATEASRARTTVTVVG